MVGPCFLAFMKEISVPQEANDHYDDCDQEHKQRYAVHAMHKLQVYIPGLIRVSFPDVEIGQYLAPHSFKL